MPLLPDGSEKGLRGYAAERGVRRRIGMAPPDRAIARNVRYKRIATEEAWTIPELVEAQIRLAASPNAPDDPSVRMGGMFATNAALQRQLQDIGAGRIAHMDEYGIDRQLLLLTSPGVQILESAEGMALARLSNDRLAEACRRYPTRLSGLLAFHPMDVEGSVREIERGMKELGLKGAVLNSHFRGHYLDEPAFEPILAALEANDAALYIHPTVPFFDKPYAARGIAGALAGFAHDVSIHTLGLLFSGAFDKFPKLRVVIGHLGECLPLHLYRFDWMQYNADGVAGLRGGQPAITLRHPASYYFKNNIWVTTSGIAWPAGIKFCIDTLGPDRVLYAMDYPYQQSSDEVAVYDRLDISLDHKRMLMQTNAERVFKL